MSMVSENLYFDQTEVTNEQWQAFELENIEKGINPEPYRINDVFNSEPFNTTYFPHESYRDYPVVGVTKLGATEYCKWRNTNSKLKGNYRLPTKNEFLQAIKEGEQSVKWFKKKIKTEKKNIKSYNLSDENEVVKMTSPSRSFLPSWRDKDELKWSSDTQLFTGPADWIGFRCACEVE